MTMMLVSDIVESNGRTVKQNNMSLTHSVPLGSLVELTECDDEDQNAGVRLFVVSHTRDCDGTPLYSLSFKKNAQTQLNEFELDKERGEFAKDKYGYALMLLTQGSLQGQILKGYSQDSFTVIKLA